MSGASSSGNNRFFPCLASSTDSGSDRNLSNRMGELDLDSGDNTVSKSSSRSLGSRARGLFSCFSDGKEGRRSTSIESKRNNSTDNNISFAVRMSRDTPSKSPAPSQAPSPPSSVTINIYDSPSPPHMRPSAAISTPAPPPPSSALAAEPSKSAREQPSSNSKRSMVKNNKNLTYNRLYCKEFKEDYEAIQYSMKIPLTAKPGQTIVNVGGLKDCSVVLPDYIVPGETVVLMVNGLKKKRVTSSNSTASTDTELSSSSSAASSLSSSSSMSETYYAESAKALSRVPSFALDTAVHQALNSPSADV